MELLKDIQLKITARPQFLHTKPGLLWASVCKAFAPAATQALFFMMQSLQGRLESAWQHKQHSGSSDIPRFPRRRSFPFSFGTRLQVFRYYPPSPSLRRQLCHLPSYIWALAKAGSLSKRFLKSHAVRHMPVHLSSPTQENKLCGSGHPPR